MVAARDTDGTHQMSEMSGDHELQCFCSTGGISCNHRATGHNRADLGGMRVEPIRSDLATPVSNGGKTLNLLYSRGKPDPSQ